MVTCRDRRGWREQRSSRAEDQQREPLRPHRDGRRSSGERRRRSGSAVEWSGRVGARATPLRMDGVEKRRRPGRRRREGEGGQGMGCQAATRRQPDAMQRAPAFPPRFSALPCPGAPRRFRCSFQLSLRPFVWAHGLLLHGDARGVAWTGPRPMRPQQYRYSTRHRLIHRGSRAAVATPLALFPRDSSGPARPLARNSKRSSSTTGAYERHHTFARGSRHHRINRFARSTSSLAVNRNQLKSPAFDHKGRPPVSAPCHDAVVGL